MAQFGLLWHAGGESIVPTSGLKPTIRPVPADRDADPERNLIETDCPGPGPMQTAMSPSLPHDSFAALGPDGSVIWCCPSLSLVATEDPRPGYLTAMDDHLFPTIVEARSS